MLTRLMKRSLHVYRGGAKYRIFANYIQWNVFVDFSDSRRACLSPPTSRWSTFGCCSQWPSPSWNRDQREWVFEVQEVKSEKKMLSLFFEKCKVKKKCFHSFSRNEKWNQNASRTRSRSENSREFLTILEKRDFTTELFDKEEEVVDFQDDFTHLALASTTRGGLTTWRRTSTRLSTRTLMTWRANLRSSRSSFLCWYPRQ